MRAVGISRSTLERRFRAALDRSLWRRFAASRSNVPGELLLETDWPMLRVARECGLRDGRTPDGRLPPPRGRGPGRILAAASPLSG